LDATRAAAQLATRAGSYQSAHLAIDLVGDAYLEGRWDDANQMVAATSEFDLAQLRSAAHTVGALIAVHREEHQTAEAELAAAGLHGQADLPPTDSVQSSHRQTPQAYALIDVLFALRWEVRGGPAPRPRMAHDMARPTATGEGGIPHSGT
jgi:hypothetical protein